MKLNSNKEGINHSIFSYLPHGFSWCPWPLAGSTPYANYFSFATINRTESLGPVKTNGVPARATTRPADVLHPRPLRPGKICTMLPGKRGNVLPSSGHAGFLRRQPHHQVRPLRRLMIFIAW